MIAYLVVWRPVRSWVATEVMKPALSRINTPRSERYSISARGRAVAVQHVDSSEHLGVMKVPTGNFFVLAGMLLIALYPCHPYWLSLAGYQLGLSALMFGMLATGVGGATGALPCIIFWRENSIRARASPCLSYYSEPTDAVSLTVSSRTLLVQKRRTQTNEGSVSDPQVAPRNRAPVRVAGAPVRAPGIAVPAQLLIGPWKQTISSGCYPGLFCRMRRSKVTTDCNISAAAEHVARELETFRLNARSPPKSHP